MAAARTTYFIYLLMQMANKPLQEMTFEMDICSEHAWNIIWQCSAVTDIGSVTFVVKSAQSECSQKSVLLDITERHEALASVIVIVRYSPLYREIFQMEQSP
jgi:hypothetical protein